MNYLLLLSISCTSPEEATDQTVSETESEISVETEFEKENEIEVDPCVSIDDTAAGIRFEGSIEYSDGTLADGTNTRVHMCAGACQNAEWGANGFCYTEGRLEPGVYSFKVVSFGFENHATPLSFITIGEEDVILDKTVLVPEFSMTGDVIDGPFDAGNGLEIDVVAENFYPADEAEVYISAVDIDPEESGLPFHNLNIDKIVGMWYLGAFDTTISPSWGFQVYDTELPIGTTVKILNSSYSNQKWIEVGTATVDSDGILKTDENSGIEILSTMVLITD